MLNGMIGKKVGMTQVFSDDGTVTPVTVIEAGPCVIVQRKSASKDGYDAVQMGLVDPKAARHANKPRKGHFAKADVPPTRVLREFRVSADAEAKPGDQVLVEMFATGQKVDVIGTSKGKGFQGVMKRHGFGGGRATHGSMFHRAPGSIGQSAWPSRVMRGMKMPGQMGSKRITVKGLKVVRVDADRNLLLVSGAIPGSKGSTVIIRRTLGAPVVTE